MNRLDHLFNQKKDHILNIYFTAGYPQLEDTGKIIMALEKAGVDLVEIGMPYSDPLADGPTIQESGQQALANGMTLPLLFEQIEAVRAHSNIPLVMMGYFNQVMQYGEEAFVKKCVEAKVDGVILPDLPLYEYEEYYRELFENAGLHISFLITPQTSEERIKKVDELTKGFIYMVSNSSITGAKSSISEHQLSYFNRINALQLKNPRLIGFGISSNQTFETACQYANGAIIGSAYIRMLAEAEDIEKDTLSFIQKIKGEIPTSLEYIV